MIDPRTIAVLIDLLDLATSINAAVQRVNQAIQAAHAEGRTLNDAELAAIETAKNSAIERLTKNIEAA